MFKKYIEQKKIMDVYFLFIILQRCQLVGLKFTTVDLLKLFSINIVPICYDVTKIWNFRCQTSYYSSILVKLMEKTYILMLLIIIYKWKYKMIKELN